MEKCAQSSLSIYQKTKFLDMTMWEKMYVSMPVFFFSFPRIFALWRNASILFNFNSNDILSEMLRLCDEYVVFDILFNVLQY